MARPEVTEPGTLTRDLSVRPDLSDDALLGIKSAPHLGFLSVHTCVCSSGVAAMSAAWQSENYPYICMTLPLRLPCVSSSLSLSSQLCGAEQEAGHDEAQRIAQLVPRPQGPDHRAGVHRPRRVSVSACAYIPVSIINHTTQMNQSHLPLIHLSTSSSPSLSSCLPRLSSSHFPISLCVLLTLPRAASHFH